MTIWQRVCWLTEQAAVAFFLFALAAVVWFHPREAAWYAFIYGGPISLALALLVLLSNWTRLRIGLLLWRHPQVLAAATAAFDANADKLALAMRDNMRLDGRWDYVWDDWVPILERFIETEVVDRLPPPQKRLIDRRGAPLRDEVYGLIDGRTWQRVQMGNLPL